MKSKFYKEVSKININAWNNRYKYKCKNTKSVLQISFLIIKTKNMGGGEEGREMAAILDLLDTILINKA